MIKFFKKIASVWVKVKVRVKGFLAYVSYLSDYFKFKKMNDGRFDVSFKNRYPQLDDKTSGTIFDRHYLYHPAWGARIVAKNKPEVHVDISSILNFATIVSAFVPVQFYDYRPADIQLSNLECLQADLLQLPFADNSIKSLSCMHTVEHVGLGRYGDPIAPDGDLKAMNELKRVLAAGGNLLFVVPIGLPKLQFNAHRVYSYKMVIENFSDLKLQEFSLINNDEGSIIKNATEAQANNEVYGCGCFWFQKYDKKDN